MNSFKIVLLSALLGVTWVDCGRRPEERTNAFPESAFEPASSDGGLSPDNTPDGPTQCRSIGPVIGPELSLVHP